MGRIISIGAQGFDNIIKENCFYVDKTEFIKEWWESRDDVTLIARPRRFGKTLNMSMLECFFSTRYEGRADLFEGLKIWQEEKYRELQGTWPVIFLSFADVKADNYKDARDGIISSLFELYKKHRYLVGSDVLTDYEKENYFILGKYILNERNTESEISNEIVVKAIKNLSEYLVRYYGKKVIIILDEYDTPMQEAYVSGYWDEIVSFFRSLFNATFKTNLYLERAIMTGVTRVSKESIFSDLNNLKVITTTSNKYAESFGFTESEVFDSLDEMDMSSEKESVKAWYDGFTFGTHKDIYNPWSITNFMEEKKYMPYWANTSGNGLISKLIQEGNAKVKVIMEDLLAGKTLKCIIDEQIVFDQLDSNEDAIWSLFLASGYLKVVTPPLLSSAGEESDFIYELALTNHEVKMMFEGLIKLWFKRRGTKYNEFIEALMLGDIKYMNRYMNAVSEAVFSFFDTGKKPSEKTEPERFYHGFVLGIIVDLKGRYNVTSNRESGFGRYDVILEPLKKDDKAFIFEFKVYDPDDEKDLKETVAMALKQIEDKKYAAILEAKGIEPDRIRKYGFAFEGKRVLIGN